MRGFSNSSSFPKLSKTSTCFQCDKKQVNLTVNPRVLHENCDLSVIFVSELLKCILQKNIWMFHWKQRLRHFFFFFGLILFFILLNFNEFTACFLFDFTMCIFRYFLLWLFIIYLSSKVVCRAGNFMTMVVLLFGIVTTLIKGPKCWTATFLRRWSSVSRLLSHSSQ